MAQKLLMRIDQEWQVQAVAAELDKQGILFEIRPKAREYASIISGMGGGAFDIFVDNESYTKANAAVQRFFMTTQAQSSETSGAPNYFKRVIVLSLMSVIFLPLIFNWFATSNYFLMRQQGVSSGRLITATVILFLAWVVAVAEVTLLLRQINF